MGAIFLRFFAEIVLGSAVERRFFVFWQGFFDKYLEVGFKNFAYLLIL